MMLPYGIAYTILEARREDHLREAEKYQLIKQVREAQRGRGRLAPVLLWLGCRLVVWGQHLEAYAIAQPASREGVRC